MAEEKNRFGEIISKCWHDTAFKQRFLTDPKSVLAEYEIEVPEGLNVKVLEESPDMMFITLPAMPPKADELTEDQLDAVSGGAGNVKRAPSAQAVKVVKFRTKVVYTQPSQTCSSGKECVPW
jgi:hypothetical protein